MSYWETVSAVVVGINIVSILSSVIDLILNRRPRYKAARKGGTAKQVERDFQEAMNAEVIEP